MACDCAQIATRDARVFRTNDAVDECDGEIESLRVLEQSGEASGTRIGMVFVGRRLGEPAPDKCDCLFCQGWGAHFVPKISVTALGLLTAGRQRWRPEH